MVLTATPATPATPATALILVVVASCLGLLVGCYDDQPDRDWNSNFGTPGANPLTELPVPTTTGPIGPVINQVLPFAPPLDLPGLPAMMPGGSLLLTDPRQAPYVSGELTNRLHVADTQIEQWTRKGRYAAPISLVQFTINTVPEIAVAGTATRGSRVFAVMFRGGAIWLGPYDARRSLFDLSGSKLEWQDVTAFGVFGPRELQLLIGTKGGLYSCAVRPGEDVAAIYKQVSDVCVVSIASLPGLRAWVLTNAGEVLAVEGKLQGEPGAQAVAWTVTPYQPAVADASGKPVGLVAQPGASADAPVVVGVRTSLGLVVGQQLIKGRVALLPRGRFAQLDDNGHLRIAALSDPATTLAEIDGMVRQAEWFDADPAGTSVVAVQGSTLSVCAINPDDPAWK